MKLNMIVNALEKSGCHEYEDGIERSSYNTVVNEEVEAKRKEALDNAKSITIKEDSSLPKSVVVKIKNMLSVKSERIQVHGWVHDIKRKGKNLMILVLRDGTGFLQCVLNGVLCQTYDALKLNVEATVTVYGVIKIVSEDQHATGGHELIVDYWTVIGHSPSGGAAAVVTPQSEVDLQLKQRHLVLRWEDHSKVIRMRSFIAKLFRDHFFDNGYTEIFPPTLVKTQSEDGSTLFAMDYFGEPDFKPLKRPFRRMTYAEAIMWLKEHNIRKGDSEDAPFYEFGEDIPEAPERKMTDTIGEPIFLHKFPHEIKSFYMLRSEDDDRLTDSVDLLLPNVGEAVGGSMRQMSYQCLMDAYKANNIDPSPYYWYTDQRRFGTTLHGGYGLGLERFLIWLLNKYHIRDVCLYPRFIGCCEP